jgi:hypothetical protein
MKETRDGKSVETKMGIETMTNQLKMRRIVGKENADGRREGRIQREKGREKE